MSTQTGGLIALAAAAVLLLAVIHSRPSRVRVLNPIVELPADGRLHRIGELRLSRGWSTWDSGAVTVTGLRAQILQHRKGESELIVQAPVLEGERTLRLAYKGRTTSLKVHFSRSTEDSAGNGTPDFLRLHTPEDRNAFRGWFVALAEAAADLPADKLPHEINDCAALLRWCYRNALHAHDEAWLHDAPASLQLTQPSVRQYAYPFTPLGAALFRVREGAFALDDASNGSFAQFADARTLWALNTFFLSRDVQAARPGDLLFFRQLEQNSPYHSMIVTGTTQRWVVYHTGPIGRGSGEMRRVLLDDLIQHPDPRWHPISSNSNFLGVYRWNILQEDPR